MACFTLEDGVRPAVLDPEMGRVLWASEECTSQPVSLRFAGPLLVVIEMSGQRLLDAETGSPVGSDPDVSGTCAIFDDRLVFTLHQEVLALALPQ